MTLGQQNAEPKQERQEYQDLQRLNAEISKHVMHSLGQPTDLYAVQVRQLWKDRFRVNVYVGANLTSARVAHSYFLKTDGDGQVINSTPRITKQYA